MQPESSFKTPSNASAFPLRAKCNQGRTSEALLRRRLLLRFLFGRLLFLEPLLPFLFLLFLLLLPAEPGELARLVLAVRPEREGDADHEGDNPDERGGDDPARELDEQAPRDLVLAVHPRVRLGGVVEADVKGLVAL